MLTQAQQIYRSMLTLPPDASEDAQESAIDAGIRAFAESAQRQPTIVDVSLPGYPSVLVSAGNMS